MKEVGRSRVGRHLAAHRQPVAALLDAENANQEKKLLK